MKKILFLILILFINYSIVDAAVEDAKFVGGTGGAKVIDLSIEQNKVDTAGIIYDKDASLVYEIIYTNNTNNSKKVVDVKLPSNDTKLNYEFNKKELDRVVEPGGTVSYTYKISSEDSNNIDVLSTLNEDANATLVFANYSFDNPETIDPINIILCIMFVSIILFVYFRKKVILYSSLVVILSIIGIRSASSVSADGTEIVDIKTNVKYILSNLAPSCASLNYEGEFCIDWKQYGDRNKVNYLIMNDTKEMSNTYTLESVSFTLQDTYDVSEQQNNEVILGVYKADNEDSYLFLIGQDGGVVVSKNGSYQFSSYDSVNNVNTSDFHFLKHVDFSKFYTNKTVDMSYMLTGISTQTDIEYLDLSGFETSNVTSMKGMFVGFGSDSKEVILDLSHFDTSKVVDMSYMFKETGNASNNVELNIANWNTSNVKDMCYMFEYFANMDSDMSIDIYNWDTSNVENMSRMFGNFNTLRQSEMTIDYFKNWNTKKVKNMSGMFSGGFFDQTSGALQSSLILDLTGLDVDSVEDFTSFAGTNIRIKQIIIPDDWNTSNATNMSGMFMLLPNVRELNVSNWDTSNVVDMNAMFLGIGASKTVNGEGIALDLSKWDVSNVENFLQMFSSANIKSLNVTGWDTSKATNVRLMFNNISTNFPPVDGKQYLDFSSLNLINVTNYSSFIISDNVMIVDLSGADWNENATVKNMFKLPAGSIIYVKDEKAKIFVEKQAPNVTVLVK